MSVVRVGVRCVGVNQILLHRLGTCLKIFLPSVAFHCAI